MTLAKPILLLLSLLAFLQGARADDIQGLVKLEIRKRAIEEGAYAYTYPLCTQQKGFTEGLSQKVAFEYEKTKFLLKGLEAPFLDLNLLNGFKMSSDVSSLIHSDGYRRAMRECFGQDLWAMWTFTSQILSADNMGRLVGVWSFFVAGSLPKALEMSAWALKYVGVIRIFNLAVDLAVNTTLTVSAYKTGKKIYQDYEAIKDPHKFEGRLQGSYTSALVGSCGLLNRRIEEISHQIAESDGDPGTKITLGEKKRSLDAMFQRRCL